MKKSMRTNVFFPMDLSIDGSMENVCKDISSRMDPRKFSFSAFASKRDYSLTNTYLIKAPDWISNKAGNALSAGAKMLYYMSKFSSIPPSILNTISMPQHLVFRQYRHADKHIHTFHGVPIFNRLGHLSGRILARNADVVISVSKYCAQLVKDYYNVDSKIIYNGIDTQYFRPRTHHNDRLQILFVGRYRRIKRPWYVIKLAKEFPQCDFFLYGLDYPLGPMLRENSRNLKNVKINSFLPHEKMREIYNNSDIFLDPSVFEGFSLAMLEAAASGLPLVCSNAASFPEFIENGKDGLLFNNYEEAKQNLSYFIEDENIRRDFAKKAREKATKFDWTIIASQYSRLFNDVSNGNF
jgi:glycosyltransferase involved in cell wall biosynthesis